MASPANHADLIADTIVDLRAGRLHDPDGSLIPEWKDLLTVAAPVDVTKDEAPQWAVYEDTTMRPPWIDALLCYVQDTTIDDAPIVVINHVVFIDADDVHARNRWESTAPTHQVDWGQVRWVAIHSIYMSVRDARSTVDGPLHAYLYAIDDNGTPLDIRWVALRPEIDDSYWAMPSTVTLRALTFLNCRNVTLVEPHRSRPQRRRLERVGVRLSEIHVFPSGTSVRGRSMPVGAGGTPLHSVRGHIARYGPRWGRGLLFGRIEGEFWIPQHARGSADYGTTEQTHTLETTA